MDLNPSKRWLTRKAGPTARWTAGDAWLLRNLVFPEPQATLTRDRLTDFKWPALTVSERA